MESSNKTPNYQLADPTNNTLQTEDIIPEKNHILKKLRGGILLVIGYLLSPLCWWNDLIFNLPIAYCFGYVCSWFEPNLMLPASIAGYWITNILGILLMQAGALDVLQQNKPRNLKKELISGFLSSTVYTILIVALIQLKILEIPNLFPGS
jgi:UDP-N-acetylmuramyl pentapeptide phosphotransferase/UDP-N-acetylglucosamine-1-phosphate transferase